MDFNNPEVRKDLSGSKGLDLVNQCTESSYQENSTLLTNALTQEETQEIRNGLAENICKLIIHQSKLSPTSNPSEDDLHKANNLIQNVVSLLQSSSDPSTFTECFLNVARKPNMPNNYNLYIPAVCIIYNSNKSITDELANSRMSTDVFAEEDWRTNLINLLPKRLFALPTGTRPTSVPSIQLLNLSLLGQLKDGDFHNGFGKVVPMQIQRFTSDTFVTLCNLCHVLRSSDIPMVKALVFHYNNGMNFNKHAMNHLGTNNASSAVKLCSEYVYLNPNVTVTLVLTELSKYISSMDKNETFYQSLTDIATTMNNDTDRSTLPSDKLLTGVNVVVKGIKGLIEKDGSSLLQEALQAWEGLTSPSAAVAAAAAIGTAAAVGAAIGTAAAIASKPGAVSSSYDSKIQQKIATSDNKPGVYSAAAPCRESRKIQADLASIKPGSVLASNDDAINRKIATSDISRPGVVTESTNNAINRKIQIENDLPGVSSQNNDTINRKIASSARPGSVITSTDDKIQRKIQIEGGGGPSKVESRYDENINRKIQANDSQTIQPSVMVTSSNEFDSNINRKISQNSAPTYCTNEPMLKDNNFSTVTEGNKKIDLLGSNNKAKIVMASEDIGRDVSKENKLIEETCIELGISTCNAYQNEMEQIANAQEFRHQLNRNQKDKKKNRQEKKKKEMEQSGWDSEQNLAVAVAIEEDDDQYFDDYDPIFAEEYDPDYKPKLYKNPRVMSRVICCFVIILVCITGVIVTFTKQVVYEPEPTGAPTPSPTASPTSYRDTLGIDTYISSYFNYNFTSSIDSSSDVSPYEYNRRLAVNWITNVDPLKLNIEDSNKLLQRYIIILLYLSTNGDHWKSCNGNDGYDNDYDFNTTNYYDDEYYNDKQGEKTVDRQVRRWLNQKERVHQDSSEELTNECNYTDYLGENYTDVRWLSDQNECEWFGIMCNKDNEVQQLLLHDNALAGTIPWEITKLPYLYRFWVNANSINGQIPEEIGTMSHLADLQLHGNVMTGTIPESLFDVSTLQAVNLALNYFTGTISDKYGQLTNLKGVHLFENHFTGTIPDSIGDLSYLAYAWLHNNIIEGPIPKSIGKLTKLLQLSLSFNHMTGKIPKEIANANNLEALLLENNKFSGIIPDELYSLTNMKNLFLHTNEFSGTISEDISNFVLAEKLIFRANNFNGAIPASLGQLDNLSNLWFQFNDFEGEMPQEICAMFEKKKAGTWVLSADCDDTMGNAAIECGCCTDCCDNVQKVCYEQ